MVSIPKNAHLWLPDYLRTSSRRRPRPLADLYFALTDHFEPAWRGAGLELQRERVRVWSERYPEIAARHRDSDGKLPQHSFFYPEEEYRPEYLDALAALRAGGWGDVEIHLHHNRDTAAGLREKLLGFIDTLHRRHGLLRTDPETGRLCYSFIHGNYALNNAHPEGLYCGVDDETSVLIETGCYADFTMPSAPNPAQARKVNAIYYVRPRTERRAHDAGSNARCGQAPPAGALLTIQGPLCLNWRRRKLGLLPRIENADLSATNPPTAERVRLWIDTAIHVDGAPQQVFIKIGTHGAQDRIHRLLLGGGLETMWTALEDYCTAHGIRLHYVTAYQMYGKIRELERAPQVP